MLSTSKGGYSTTSRIFKQSGSQDHSHTGVVAIYIAIVING